jgi:putative tryptophan/tyrosine transport system substrate-binding protein
MTPSLTIGKLSPAWRSVSEYDHTGTSRALPKFESYGMPETAAFRGWKAQDAIEWFHGIGRLVPSLHRLAIMFDGGYRASVGENGEVQAMARKLGLEAAPYEIRRTEDIARVFDALKGQADALYVVGNALTEINVSRIVTLALGAQLPTSLATAESVRAGGLMSYGPDYPAMFRRAADYVDKILHGTRPGDLPVEQPTKFDLVINLKTAKALGLTNPHNLLVLADEVIE